MSVDRDMKRSRNALAGALALAATAALATAGPAMAGCGLYNPLMPPAQRVTPVQEGTRLVAAVYRPGLEGFIPVADEAERGKQRHCRAMENLDDLRRYPSEPCP